MDGFSLVVLLAREIVKCEQAMRRNRRHRERRPDKEIAPSLAMTHNEGRMRGLCFAMEAAAQSAKWSCAVTADEEERYSKMSAIE